MRTFGRMGRAVIAVLFLLLSFDIFAAFAFPPLVKGGKLPVINLPIPKDPNEKNYLGLSGTGYFNIPRIKTQMVIIKVFNIYCPNCQSIASATAELFHHIENDPSLKGKIKLIGIGAGNSAYEVESFKKTFHIPYPVFPDEDYIIHKALGEVRIPFFIAIEIHRDGSHEVVYTQLGAFAGVELFLEPLLEASGLKQKNSSLKQEEAGISLTNESR